MSLPGKRPEANREELRIKPLGNTRMYVTHHKEGEQTTPEKEKERSRRENGAAKATGEISRREQSTLS